MQTKTKVIYTLNLRLALHKRGLDPVFEIPNPRKPQYIAWVYERTPEFDKAFNELYNEMKEARNE